MPSPYDICWPPNGALSSAKKAQTNSGLLYPPLPGADYEMKPRNMSPELAALMKCDPSKRHRIEVVGTAAVFLGYPYVEGRWAESGKTAHWPLDDFYRLFEAVNNVTRMARGA